MLILGWWSWHIYLCRNFSMARIITVSLPFHNISVHIKFWSGKSPAWPWQGRGVPRLLSGGSEDEGAVLPSAKEAGSTKPQVHSPLAQLIFKACSSHILQLAWAHFPRTPPHTPEAHVLEWGGAGNRRGYLKVPRFGPPREENHCTSGYRFPELSSLSGPHSTKSSGDSMSKDGVLVGWQA